MPLNEDMYLEQIENFGKTWKSLSLSEKYWREELNKTVDAVNNIPPLTECSLLLPLIESFDRVAYIQSQLANVAAETRNLYQEIYTWYNKNIDEINMQ
jgi:hypothetical protein